MDNMKHKIECQLVANVIKDKCAHCEEILFSESWCTQERCIRFTLPIFRALFPPKQNAGDWDSGDFVMFEVNNKDTFEIICNFASECFPKEYENDRDIILKEFGVSNDNVFMQLRCNSLAPNVIFDFFEDFLSKVLPKLQRKILGAFILPAEEDVFKEGDAKQITSIRYERNRKARELCLSYYGKACRRCGLDFAEKYGEEYANLIEVHHIVPISGIGDNYIVDPVKDLIPLCPNCHAMTHYDIKMLKK